MNNTRKKGHAIHVLPGEAVHQNPANKGPIDEPPNKLVKSTGLRT